MIRALVAVLLISFGAGGLVAPKRADAQERAKADRYALIVVGAAGGDAYAQKYGAWRAALAATLAEKLGYEADHLLVLDAATREDVRRTLSAIGARTSRDSQLLVVLFGHGTSIDGEPAKFNLAGPDMSAAEWSAALKPIQGRLVFVDTTGGSFPFLQALASRGRIVVSATDSTAQQFDTVFPEFFVKALDDPAADADRNGRVSLWEAFAYASANVRRWFDQRGRLPTERALLDDTGAGVGREAQSLGADGALARITYLDADPAEGEANETRAGLLKRQAEIQNAIEELKARKDAMPAADYDAALEKLLLDLARISQQLRNRS